MRKLALFIFQMLGQSRSFKFPYKKIKTDFGVTPYPFVGIQLLTKEGFIVRDFLVDTGADVTTLPHFMAYELGIDLNKLDTGKSRGIGENLVKTWEAKINIRLCDVDFRVRCSFVSSDEIPPLLGKLDIFDKFNLYFDNDRELLKLTKKSQSITSFRL